MWQISQLNSHSMDLRPGNQFRSRIAISSHYWRSGQPLAPDARPFSAVSAPWVSPDDCSEDPNFTLESFSGSGRTEQVAGKERILDEWGLLCEPYAGDLWACATAGTMSRESWIKNKQPIGFKRFTGLSRLSPGKMWCGSVATSFRL